jgi:hypothetical protein
MGAGEVGRELGDAGGPILVGAFSPAGLAAGLLALATTIGLGALATWRRAPAHPDHAPRPTPGSDASSPPVLSRQ